MKIKWILYEIYGQVHEVEGDDLNRIMKMIKRNATICAFVAR